jgi:transposase-like protein
LTELLRDGARRLIAHAVQAEFEEFLERHAQRRDDRGRGAVVRNGHLPERKLLTGIGPVRVKVPKGRTRAGEAAVFRSLLVPPFVRSARSVEAALAWLYLKGVSAGDMAEALRVLVGPQAKGLSAPVVSRLKRTWQADYATWCKTPLGKDRWVYVWADGIYSGLQCEAGKLCVLVVISVNDRGQKRLLAIEDGVRESAQNWREVLLSLRARRLAVAPQLGMGDGALAFWKALDDVYQQVDARWRISNLKREWCPEIIFSANSRGLSSGTINSIEPGLGATDCVYIPPRSPNVSIQAHL